MVNRAGRIDLMFNNAGITWGGDTELLTLDQWNSIIDVNIRGVVHGVAAAYPQMIRQGHGHIVNTASMAGGDERVLDEVEDEADDDRHGAQLRDCGHRVGAGASGHPRYLWRSIANVG